MINFSDLNKAQAAYAVEQIRKMGEAFIDVCKDICGANQGDFSKVSKLIGDHVYKTMADKIDAADSIDASNISDIDKCRSLIESWWTLSEVDAHAISLFLDCGGFNTKQHRAWISDVVRKQVDSLYMHKLSWVFGVVIYAILYV